MSSIKGEQDLQNIKAIHRVIRYWDLGNPVQFVLMEKWPELAYALTVLKRTYRAPVVICEMFIKKIHPIDFNRNHEMKVSYKTLDELLACHELFFRNMMRLTKGTMVLGGWRYDIWINIHNTGKHEENQYGR